MRRNGVKVIAVVFCKMSCCFACVYYINITPRCQQHLFTGLTKTGQLELTGRQYLSLCITFVQNVNYFVNFLINSLHNYFFYICLIFILTEMVAVLVLYFVMCAFDDNNNQVL